MLKDALQERTKKWSGLGDEDLDLLTVHEAYQYLSRTFVDDAAKNTVANQQGNCLHFASCLFTFLTTICLLYIYLGAVMSIAEINAKFRNGELWSTMYIDSKNLEKTPKEDTNNPPNASAAVNNDNAKRKSLLPAQPKLKFTSAVRRNTLAAKAIIPIKSLEPIAKKEEMLTMQIIPKKGLAKSSSESRYAILRKEILDNIVIT